MRNLSVLIVFLFTSQIALSVGEDSGAGGRRMRELFNSLSPAEALSHPAFIKNIPSIKMPGTSSYFKATALCIKGSKIKTKKIRTEACVRWSYFEKSTKQEVETSDRALATRKKASCVAYEASILTHPIEYSVEETLSGIPDDEGNLHDTINLGGVESRYNRNVNVKRLVSKSVSKVMNIDFYATKEVSQTNDYDSADYLGMHKYNLDKCKTPKTK